MPPLGLLFAFLALCFAGLAVAAAAHNLVVTIAAIALSAWFASTAYTVFRRSR